MAKFMTGKLTRSGPAVFDFHTLALSDGAVIHPDPSGWVGGFVNCQVLCFTGLPGGFHSDGESRSGHRYSTETFKGGTEVCWLLGSICSE
jgi:hypothetical protein